VGGEKLRRHLQGVQRLAAVPLGCFSQKFQRFIVNGKAKGAKPPFSVGQRATDKVGKLSRFKLLQAQHPAAGEQRGDDFKGGVFGGGADDGDQPFFNGREKGILLGLVETMDLIHKEDGALALKSFLFRLFEYLPDLPDSGHDGGEKDEA